MARTGALMHLEKILMWDLLMVILAVQNGFGIVRHNGSADQDYITYGNQFKSTVFAGYQRGNTFSFRASAVVIDAHWAVCSAHQFFDSSGNFLYNGAFIGTGSNFISDPGELFIADQWFRYPGSTSSPYGTDIALLYFKEPITGADFAPRFRGTLDVSSTVSIIGYGRGGTPDSGYLAADYHRRGCRNRIDPSDDAAGYPEYSHFSVFYPPGTADYDPLGGIAGSGDSGGGWFNEDGMLVGISVEAGAFAPNYYSYTIAQDITYFNDWIDAVMTRFNHTRRLDIRDFARFSACWLSTAGDIRYNGGWDLATDGEINLLDLCSFADQWLYDEPSPTSVLCTSESIH
jgi:hypothetical protein